MKLSDFDYHLPNELIARYPLTERSASRLLYLNRAKKTIQHRQVKELPELLQPNDLLIFNNTRVIPARFFGQKETGGQVEVLIERILDSQHILAHLRVSKPPKIGSSLWFANQVGFEMLGRKNDLFKLKCLSSRSVMDVIEEIGSMPLPPYFQRQAEEQDKERYQTIYAEHNGSVAAPTAGLHFDKALFAALENKKITTDFVTLHVGAGTFTPVRVENITEHRMHREYMQITPALCTKIAATKASGGKVIAVGTTTARSLETACQTGTLLPYEGETDIFIYPGFQFKCIDALLTNFHLPKSSLLMLVSAMVGLETTMETYKMAIAEKYRFFSYGDAMLIE